MKVDVPGRGAVDISRVAIVGPVWTSLDMYRETCEFLHETANAGGISFRGLMWRGRTNAGMLRQMVRDLADEFPDGTPCIDGVCLLPGWNTDGPTTFAAAGRHGAQGGRAADAEEAPARHAVPAE